MTEQRTPTKAQARVLANRNFTKLFGDGPIHPRAYEWMMGFPLGWTDLEHSETPSSVWVAGLLTGCVQQQREDGVTAGSPVRWFLPDLLLGVLWPLFGLFGLAFGNTARRVR